MVVADEITIRVSELDFGFFWRNSNLGKKNDFWDLYNMYDAMMIDDQALYIDPEQSRAVDGYVEKYKKKLISYLVKKHKSEYFDAYGMDFVINQNQKNLKWKNFKLHKKSDTKYIGKSKDGLSFKLRFYVDEDVDLNRQIENFIELDALNDFIISVDDDDHCFSGNFTMISQEEKIERIGFLLILGCFLGHLDDLDYNYADHFFKIIDQAYENDDWKRGVSIARDSGTMQAYGVQYDEIDYPLHPMFAR